MLHLDKLVVMDKNYTISFLNYHWVKSKIQEQESVIKSRFHVCLSIPALQSGHSGGRRGGMNWVIGIDIYTLPCVKQIASGKLLYSTGNSARCSAVTLRGWEGGPRGRGHMYTYS